METSEKMKALEAARLQIEKQFGQGAIMKLGDKANASGIDVVPSGSILLDLFSGQSGHGHLVIFDSGNAVICSLYINRIFIL